MSNSSENSNEHFIQIDDPKNNSSTESHSPKKHIISSKYNDYYEWMGCAKELRPITITEGLEWHTMTAFKKLIWWIGTCIQMLTLTILSLRTDRLAQINSYMKHHWKHYSGGVLKGPLTNINISQSSLIFSKII